MKKQNVTVLLLLFIVVLSNVSPTVWGCNDCNPPCSCAKCQKCQDGVCVSRCSSALCQTCVNGRCPSTCSGCETCVNGSCESTCDTSLCQTCINDSCQSTCSGCETCVNGSCESHCDTSLCQDCIGGSCQSKCDPEEMCVNGECECNPDANVITYTYDEVGNRTSMKNNCATTIYTYDYLNRLTSVTDPDNNTITYDYDPNGNRIQMTLLRQGYGEQSTTYTYTDNNQLETVTIAEDTTIYQYDGLGNIEQVDYPNGTYTEYTYHPTRNWLESVINRQSDGTIISAYYYNDYDNVGNRLSVTEFDGSVVSYGYDNIYQLMSETRTGTNAYAISYTYDNAGNRETMTKNGVNTGYTYNYNNQLLTEVIDSDTTFTYDYDDNGNLISKDDGANSTLYTWDYDNRLISLNSPLSTINYSYDGDGNRISKTVDGVTTNYINDVGLGLVQVLAETDDTGDTVLASYTYGNDLISQVTSNPSPVTSYYHYDGLGSVRQLTDDTQAVVAEYTYDAFGNLIANTGTSENTYKFTGEQFDSSSGLLYLRARYYDARVGRFISRDPILKPMKIGDNFVWLLPNLISQPKYLQYYQYVNNNPLNYTDPSGYENWWDGFIEWLRNLIGYIPPSPLGELTGACQAAPDLLKIAKERERWNEIADELGVERPYQ